MTRSCVETSSTSCSSFPSWTTASCASCAASWPVWLHSSRSAGTRVRWPPCSAPTSSSKMATPAPLEFFLFLCIGYDVATQFPFFSSRLRAACLQKQKTIETRSLSAESWQSCWKTRRDSLTRRTTTSLPPMTIAPSTNRYRLQSPQVLSPFLFTGHAIFSVVQNMFNCFWSGVFLKCF